MITGFGDSKMTICRSNCQERDSTINVLLMELLVVV
jgi:hypothetical protein